MGAQVVSSVGASPVRSSSRMWSWCRRSSALRCIVRNFTTVNGCPPRPSRIWRKRTGPGESSLTDGHDPEHRRRDEESHEGAADVEAALREPIAGRGRRHGNQQLARRLARRLGWRHRPVVVLRGGQGGRIRTAGLLLPKQVRYQAALRPARRPESTARHEFPDNGQVPVLLDGPGVGRAWREASAA